MTPSSERWGCVDNLFVLALESKVNKDFLALVRLGSGAGTEPVQGSMFNVQCSIDWQGVKDLAEQQGLGAVVLDGIEKLPDGQRPPQLFLLEWIGETLQGYEYRYEQYEKAVSSLAGFYSSHGIKMMVLKGYACSLDWPRPEHRPCGDIDIWLFGRQPEADALIESLEFRDECLESDEKFESVKKIVVDRSHHHHTVFNWGDFTVENHYDFINIHRHKSHKGLEDIFKELGQDDSHYVEVKSASTTSAGSAIGLATKVYLPSSNLHALFLVRHALNHFASIGINLRQVLDWAFFVKKHESEIDWKWFWGVVDSYSMRDFVNCLNATCVEELGFEAYIFHGVQFNPAQKDRILQEIISPKFGLTEPKWLLPRMVYKYRRWKGSEWKRKLCYAESRSNSFWSGVWNTILKPASI